jgi:outer membrane autotransporter protein
VLARHRHPLRLGVDQADRGRSSGRGALPTPCAACCSEYGWPGVLDSGSGLQSGIYGGKAWGPLALRTGLTYAWHDIETSRQVAFQGFSDNLQSAYSANTSQVFGELGYSLKAGPVALEPFANLAYVDVHTQAFQERGGAAALTAQEGNTAMTFSTLGAHASTQLGGSLANATLRGTLGWRHAFGSTTPTSSLAFASAGSPADIAGAPIDRDAAVVVVGLDIALSPVSTLGFAYSGQVGPNTTDQSLQANLSLRF